MKGRSSLNAGIRLVITIANFIRSTTLGLPTPAQLSIATVGTQPRAI